MQVPKTASKASTEVTSGKMATEAAEMFSSSEAAVRQRHSTERRDRRRAEGKRCNCCNHRFAHGSSLWIACTHLSVPVKPVRPPATRSQAGEIYSRDLSIHAHEAVI
jgi:hypothetical protein